MSETLPGTASRGTPVPRGLRLAISVELAALTWFFALTRGAQRKDFAQAWFAARALLRGRNPYALIGPGREFEWSWTFFYPLHAAIAAMPFAPFAESMASALFAAVGVGVLAWTLAEFGYPSLLGLTSVAALQAVGNAQWSPLLTGALGIAPLAVFWVAKPNIGAAFFVVRPSWWAFGGFVVLSVIAFALQPNWLNDWRGALASADVASKAQFARAAPVMVRGGVLVVLAGTRWRRAEARLLVSLACVPHTMSLYEVVPLLLIPRGWWEVSAFTALTYLSHWWVEAKGPYANAWEHATSNDLWIVLLLYLPATAMVLLRPNEGPLPQWLERRVAMLPLWIRGERGPT